MVRAPGENFHDSSKLLLSLDIFPGNYILSMETMLDTPLLLAHQAIRRLTAKALSNLALSPDEARVLEVVGGAEHPTMGQVAGRAGLTLSALSKLADRLEARGLLRRTDDEVDTRCVHLSLTFQGDRLRTAAMAEMAKIDKQLAERIGSWEMDRLEKLLAKINA
jgi:DNA-binding MarR family transcriptional regulator